VKGFQNDTLMNEGVLEMARSNHRLYKKLESYFPDIRFNGKRHITAMFMQKLTRGFSWERLFGCLRVRWLEKGKLRPTAILIPKPGLNVFKGLVL
jgi:hypothetical protein